MTIIYALLATLMNTMICVAAAEAPEEKQKAGLNLQNVGISGDTGGISLLNSRPSALENHIQERLNYVQLRTTKWGQYSGVTDYGLMGFPDALIAEGYVKNHPHATEFVFADFGSGDHSWGRYLAWYLQSAFAHDISTGKKVFHIVSLTGDDRSITKPVPDDFPVTILQSFNKQQKGCTIYELSSFPLEGIDEALPPDSRFDLIFSFATLRHMADPVGTLVRVYNMLKDDGALITEGTLKASINGRDMPNLRSILDLFGLNYLNCPLSENIDNILLSKKQNSGIKLTYESIKETPGLLNTHASVTSPVIVNFMGDEQPQVMSKFVVSALFPEISTSISSSCSGTTTRRDGMYKLSFSGDIRLLQEYVCSCYRLMPNYLDRAVSVFDLRRAMGVAEFPSEEFPENTPKQNLIDYLIGESPIKVEEVLGSQVPQ